MTKLVVEVVGAVNLMPKDGHGSATPYAEVEFGDVRHRTHAVPKELNPQWNRQLVFDIPDSDSDLFDKTISVDVYNDGGPHKNFLGRVRISAASVPSSPSDASVERYPLDKRGIFSHIRGEIDLKIYFSDDPSLNPTPLPPPPANEPNIPLHQGRPNPNSIPDNHNHNHGGAGDGNFEYREVEEEEREEEVFKKKPKKKKEHRDEEVRTFFSVPSAAASAPNPGVETRADFMRPSPPGAMYMQMPGPPPGPIGGGGGGGPGMMMKRPGLPAEYELVETRPPVAARMGYRGGDKIGSTYDLVEQMHYLYVNVVKARDLPDMDIAGSLDPYVEVKLGNYKGVTRHLEKNQNPVWHQIFAFSKDRLQAHVLEVVVKDKDVGKDDFVGRVVFDLAEIPLRVPPDSPLAPQWYRLEDKRGDKSARRGEIMLAVWVGTQADEAFPEAWHSDAHALAHHSNLASTRSKVYFSPKLYYLRVHVIEAQDLLPLSSSGRAPESAIVKVQLGNQLRMTRPSQLRTPNPMWNEELMFVASEPFDEYVILSVEDRVAPGRDEILGRMILPVRDVPHRLDPHKIPDPRWFNLVRPSMGDPEAEGEKKKEIKFASKIHLRLTMDAGYHVLDESTHFSSDLQPSSKLLRKPSIGILELGILGAKNLLPMKGKDGRLTDPYCVAKYGNKWVRTRTLLDTLHPRWNEQYTWEVHDPCTVITIGVFDNCQVNAKEEARDQRIGKVRIRLSTLATDQIYTHFHPLLVLTPSGLKKHGELHLAVRFSCTAWVNMVALYGRPLLPKMHYAQPIAIRHIDWLRHQATQIVGNRLARAEPPLRKEVVEYMLDMDYNMWSLRRSKANFTRIMGVLAGVTAVCRWMNEICFWRNPITTCLVHVLFLILVCYPELILPTIFLYLFVIGVWNYRYRPRHPPHMDARLSLAETAHPDELDEEFDSFPSSRPNDVVRMRYDRLRSVAGRVQAVAGDLATQGERAQAILSWRDPRATALFIFFSLVWAVFLYVTPFQVVAVLVGLYLLRHPRFRSRMPSVPINFFKRLPSKSDMLL